MGFKSTCCIKQKAIGEFPVGFFSNDSTDHILATCGKAASIIAWNGSVQAYLVSTSFWYFRKFSPTTFRI